MHCIAGLYDSLLDSTDERTHQQRVTKYKNYHHSPAVGLYSQNCTLIKEIVDGKFAVLDAPFTVDVISFSNEGREKDAEITLEALIAMAIINQTDILIISRYFKDQCENILVKAEFKGKIREVIFYS